MISVSCSGVFWGGNVDSVDWEGGILVPLVPLEETAHMGLMQLSTARQQGKYISSDAFT